MTKEEMAAALGQLKCRTCHGRTVVDVAGVEIIEDCPDCQQDGKPTGLAFPELTVECSKLTEQEKRWGMHKAFCPECHGYPIIPLTGDALTMAGERALERLLPFFHVEYCSQVVLTNGERTPWWTYCTPVYVRPYIHKSNKDRQAALLAALWELSPND